MPEKEFKRMIIRLLKEIQENTDKQLNEIRKSIQDMNGKLSRFRDIEKESNRNIRNEVLNKSRKKYS